MIRSVLKRNMTIIATPNETREVDAAKFVAYMDMRNPLSPSFKK